MLNGNIRVKRYINNGSKYYINGDYWQKENVEVSKKDIWEKIFKTITKR